MIEEIILAITINTKRIRVGLGVYSKLKTALGNVATKIKGVDFMLDESLDRDAYVIEK